MTELELKDIYRQACQLKGYMPLEDQFKAWKRQFSFAEARDLRNAIDQWFKTNTAFPMPAELLPAVERAAQSRSIETSAPRSLVAWRCPLCGHSMIGFLTASDRAYRNCPSFYAPIGSKTCLPLGSICGYRMEIRLDERAMAYRETDRRAMASNTQGG